MRTIKIAAAAVTMVVAAGCHSKTATIQRQSYDMAVATARTVSDESCSEEMLEADIRWLGSGELTIDTLEVVADSLARRVRARGLKFVRRDALTADIQSARHDTVSSKVRHNTALEQTAKTDIAENQESINLWWVAYVVIVMLIVILIRKHIKL